MMKKNSPAMRIFGQISNFLLKKILLKKQIIFWQVLPKLENLGTSLSLCLCAKTGSTKFWETVFGICLHLFPVCFENILVILSIFFGSSTFSRAFATLPGSKHFFNLFFVELCAKYLTQFVFLLLCLCLWMYHCLHKCCPYLNMMVIHQTESDCTYFLNWFPA